MKNKKDTYITVRVTTKTKAALHEIAAENGMKPSEYVHYLFYEEIKKHKKGK